MRNHRKRKLSASASEEKLDLLSRQKVEKLFQKRFTYTKPDNGEKWNLPNSGENGWNLPNLTDRVNSQSIAWKNDDLELMKNDLNSLKDRLSDKDVISWNEHTCYMNYAVKVIPELRQRFNPELCTQAWCKFYEIVSSYPLVDIESDEFNSIHLCEAPGAFITSLNHYLVASGYGGEWTWTGTSLNPYYEGNSLNEMIEDDKFVRFSYDHWYFGVDDTGNLLKYQNFKGLLDHADKIGPIHLVTADGSFDCQNSPAEQEIVVSRLKYCETLAALLLLTPGGSFVMKMFTMFESYTLYLLYLLNCLFEQVNVFKPATSKGGNSEVYCICTGFIGLQNKEDFINFSKPFFESTRSEVPCIFSVDEIPESFVKQHIQCCKFFSEIQKQTIKTNLENYPVLPEDYRNWLDNVKDYCATCYIARYGVRFIPKSYCITGIRNKKRSKSKREKNGGSLPPKRRHSGTFMDRQKYYALCWKDKLKYLPVYDVSQDNIIWFERSSRFTYTDQELVNKWRCVQGIPITNICSSKFCEGKLIDLVQEILTQANLESHCKSLQSDIYHRRKIINETVNIIKSDRKLSLIIIDTGGQVVTQSFTVTGIEEIITKSLPDIITAEFDVIYQQYIFYLNLTENSEISLEREIQTQQVLLQTVTELLQHLPNSSTLVIQMSSCLTRFIGGLIYLLAQAFELIGFLQYPGSSSLQQCLLCTNFYGLPSYLLQHLQQVAAHRSENGMDILETVPIRSVVSDAEFTSFLRKTNENLLKSFVTSVIKREREIYGIEDPPV